MDINSATEEIDVDLGGIIKDTCAATGRLDHDMIIAQATKNISPQALVRQCVEEYPETITRRLLGYEQEALCELIEGHDPEDVLRDVIDDLITPEEHLIYGSGVSPAAATAFVRMQEVDREQYRTEAALIRVIRPAIMAACRAVWDETHTTDEKAAAEHMMSAVPAIADAFRKSWGGEPKMREIFADCYSEFLEEQSD